MFAVLRGLAQEALEKEHAAKVSNLEAELGARNSSVEQLKRALARTGGSSGAMAAAAAAGVDGDGKFDEKRAGGGGIGALFQQREPATRIESSKELLSSLEDSKRKLKDIEARARAGLVGASLWLPVACERLVLTILCDLFEQVESQRRLAALEKELKEGAAQQIQAMQAMQAMQQQAAAASAYALAFLSGWCSLLTQSL